MGITIEYKGRPLAEVAREVHEVTVRRCEYCGAEMTESDVNDYGTLCESCYMKEYYGEEC